MWVAATAFLLLFQTDFNAEGRKALEAEKYDLAAELFAKAAEADPKDFTAHFHLALAYSMLKKDVPAIAEYKKVLELKPGLYEAELNLGILLLRQKQAAEAVAYLKEAAGKKPQEFRARYYYAESLGGSGNWAGAEPEFQAALGINSKSADAEAGLGRALARQNRLEEAAPHYRKAIELDPGFSDALLELADLYEKNGRKAEAIEIYQRFPQNAAVQERLGELLLETKKYGEAIPRLEAAYQSAPTEANQVALATAYIFAKQYDKANPLLEKAVASNPRSYDLRMMHGRSLRDAKQYQLAAQQFHEGIKLKPESREAWNELAAMLYLLGGFPQSLAAFERARQLGENTPANAYFRAIIQDRMQQYQPALEAYQQFLATSQGKNPDEEFKARQRVRIIQKELSKR
jgi:tetratricopeptide (TPR) repeat protein